MPEIIEPGTVWLVGAGPGDPDLLTRKAEKLIATADIVFTDALVGPKVIDLIPATAEIISVGKRSGRHSKDQRTINAMIVEAALSGKCVVRLKGGDPSVFGRSSEELEACRAARVPAFICPGITAASAAAAAAGVSLSLRGAARNVTFVTAHACGSEPLHVDWAALAHPESTLAVYMGKTAARDISMQLMRAGLAGRTPVLIVENASLPTEKVIRTRLDLLPLTSGGKSAEGPAIFLIGATCGQAFVAQHGSPAREITVRRLNERMAATVAASA